MAYQHWDGFDHYDGSHELWDSVTGTPTYSTSYARFPAAAHCAGLGMRCTGGVFKQKNLNSNQATLIFGFAVYLESMPTGGGLASLLRLNDSGNAQCQLSVSSSGAIALMPGTALTGPLAISPPSILGPNRYYWIDVEITINNTTGSVLVYVSTPAGGSAVLSATGLNTRQTGNNYANSFLLGEIQNVITAARFDDLHCHDITGSAPNSILGEGTRIYTKLPNGAGYATTLTPNGAAANWQCVDDNPPDDDTTYNSAASFPLTEGYAIGAAGFTGTVNGVVRRSRVRKDDGSAHTFQNGVRSGSTNALATAVAVLSSYAYTDSFSSLDPATSAAWTAAGADAAQPIISAAS